MSARKKRVIQDDDEDEDDDDDGGGGDDDDGGVAEVTEQGASSSRRHRRSHRPSHQEDEEDEEEEDEESDASARRLDAEDERWVELNGERAVDEITSEPLSALHVVWRSPDGSQVLRFNLSTLRKVAQRAGEWRSPPHFRTGLDVALRAQIVRKFGKRALHPVWASGSSASQGGIGSTGELHDLTFFERLAEWDARRLSDVHNLYVCPICFLWLRTTDEDGNDRRAQRRGGDGEEEEEEEEEDDDDDDDDDDDADVRPCDPIGTLFGAPCMSGWNRKTALPPEVGASQCCFRKQAELTHHLRRAHCLTDKQMRGTRERLSSYQVRGGDGLVHKWVNHTSGGAAHGAPSSTSSASQRRRGAGAPSEGNVRGYWHSSAEAVASAADEFEANWFSRAALYLALYDEVDSTAGGSGGAVAQGDEALFAHRINVAARPARPCGVATSEVAREYAIDAWQRLGFGGGDDDDLDTFVKRDDESSSDDDDDDGGGGGSEEDEEEDEEGGREGRRARAKKRRGTADERSQMALYMQQTMGDEESQYDSSFVDDSDEAEEGEEDPYEYGEEEEGEEEEGEEEEEGSEISYDGGHVSTDFMTRRVEYDEEPDALDRAENRLKEKKKQEKQARKRGGAGSSSSSAQRAGPSSAAPPSSGRQQRRIVIDDDDDEGAVEEEEEEDVVISSSSRSGKGKRHAAKRRRLPDEDDDEE